MKLNSEEKSILLSLPILFLFATLFHFVYEFSNENLIVGLFTPINESVWEHLKMIIIPPTLLWIGLYIINKDSLETSKNRWFTSALISIVTMIIAIPLMFYFYTNAFGVELLWVDIAITFIAIILGQLIGLHFYKHSNGIDWRLAIAILLAIILIFAIFTFSPPHIPIFMDSTTGEYGI